MVFTLALIGCIAFIFSNSMKIASVSSVSSGRVLQLLQAVLRRLGHPGLAQRLTMHIVRKMAHFCEYTLEGFLLMLCMRVYTRRYAPAHQRAHAGRCAHGHGRRDDPDLFPRAAAVRSPTSGWTRPVCWPAS
ncbi:MAG: VanZ family protein [Faecalibacterium sp.]